MEQDDGRDMTHLQATWTLIGPSEGDDDPATGWIWINNFSTPTRHVFSREIDIRRVRDIGDEHLYLVAVSRPDIVAHVAYSAGIRYRDQPGTTFSPIET
jgi:hypothetical protein